MAKAFEPTSRKLVYLFGIDAAAGGRSDGNAGMKDLLGGKGANLAEMAALGLPVPPGCTITTEVCTAYQTNGGKIPEHVQVALVAQLFMPVVHSFSTTHVVPLKPKPLAQLQVYPPVLFEQVP